MGPKGPAQPFGCAIAFYKHLMLNIETFDLNIKHRGIGFINLRTFQFIEPKVTAL